MTHLQMIASKVNWFIGFRLHTIAPYSITSLGVNPRSRTYKAVRKYNEAVYELKQCIKDDYKSYAEDWRAHIKELEET